MVSVEGATRAKSWDRCVDWGWSNRGLESYFSHCSGVGRNYKGCAEVYPVAGSLDPSCFNCNCYAQGSLTQLRS